MKKTVLFFIVKVLIFFSSLLAEGQIQVKSLSLPVNENTNRLQLAFAGGLQAPQFNQIDLNFDGTLDLLVFDRSDNNLLPFINTGIPADTGYIFTPELTAFFPPDLHDWFILRDYNCDGKPDIFTAGLFDDIRVFKNTSQNGLLSFQLEKTSLQAGNLPMDIPAGDLPAIIDVDNDGDLDILGFTSGSDFVSWFKNMRVENNLSCATDPLVFQRATRCWGLFEEDFFNSNIILGIGCGGNKQTQKPLGHSGSTLLLLDADNDGDKEALIGDISSDKLVFLQNGGSPATANMVAQSNTWPPATPVSLYSFPAAFYLDVDNDQVNDLVIAPNATAKNFEQVQFYKNLGTSASPNFSFKKHDFLVGEMLEFGTGAYPTFADLDRDGDLDLIVGNDTYTTNASVSGSQVAYYQNAGSNANPKYNLVTKDLAGLRSRNLFSVAPTFGDLDNDGDADMLLGEAQGFIWYFRNDAVGNQPAQFTLITQNLLNQSIGSNSVPTLFDVDNDNDLDLIIGERNGNLNFFQNNGTVSNPVFNIVSSTFGNIDVRNPVFGAGYATPAIANLDQNNIPDLLVGDFDGKVHFYPDFATNLSGTFTEKNIAFLNNLSNSTEPLRPGRRVAPAIANLTPDTQPDIVVGLSRGGLRAFQNQGIFTGLNPEIENKAKLEIYPNPFQNAVSIKFSDNPQTAEVSVSDLVGNIVSQQKLQLGTESAKLELTKLNPGIYFLTLTFENGAIITRKIIKITSNE